MTHETHKRWPPTAGAEADYITVDAHGSGSAAAARLRLYGIPHSTVYACKPPTLEGWSFSVYNGAEEHASGWGSATLADMAPALLAAIGMTDAATANKRAQVAEQVSAEIANDRDGAVEALDTANDMIGKLCVVMAGAGFNGDLLVGVQLLIKQRDAAEQERKDMSANLKRWEDFVRGYLPTVTLATNTADRHFDFRVALGEHLAALTKESDAAKRDLTTAQVQLRDISRLLGQRRGDESVGDQAERTRRILDRWQDLAVKHLPGCPQVSFTLAVADLGSRHFALRGYIEGEISALRARLSLCAEREDQTIAALGHPCSTNGIPEAVRLLRRDAERWLTECGEVGARAAAYVAENVRLSTQRDDACAAAKQWEAEARKAWAYGDQIGHVLPTGGPTDGLLERAVATAGEVTALREQCKRLEDRRNVDAENEAAWIEWAHQWGCQLLASPSAENLRWTIGKRIEDLRTDLRVSREVLENVARVTDLPSGTSLVDRVAKVYKNSERADRMTEEVARLNKTLENTGGYGARERVKALERENGALRNQVATLTAAVDGDLVRSAKVLAAVRTALETPERMGLAGHAAQVLRRAKVLDAWQTWARNKVGVNATVSDESLRNAIDAREPTAYATITNLRTEVDMWKAEAAKTFTQLQEAYDATNSAPALSDDSREALDYLIAHPGRGLTAELGHEGAKALRQRLENGLPYTQPLRYLINMALSAGVNATHQMWDGEVLRIRDEATTLRKRLDQWVAWGCRAACVIAADDDTLRTEIDKALPMWRRGAPQV